MASVRFVFDGGAEMVVRAGSDRSAKLMVTGMRRRVENEGPFVEVKGEDGSQFVNVDRLCFVELLVSGGGSSRKSAKKASKAAPAKKRR